MTKNDSDAYEERMAEKARSIFDLVEKTNAERLSLKEFQRGILAALDKQNDKSLRDCLLKQFNKHDQDHDKSLEREEAIDMLIDAVRENTAKEEIIDTKRKSNELTFDVTLGRDRATPITKNRGH